MKPVISPLPVPSIGPFMATVLSLRTFFMIMGMILWPVAISRAALSSAEIERLRQVVFAPYSQGQDLDAYWAERAKGFQSAAEGGAYEVFEAAMHSNRVGLRSAALVALRKSNVPEERKRQMLLHMISNPALWPDPGTPEGGMTMNKYATMELSDFRSELKATVTDARAAGLLCHEATGWKSACHEQARTPVSGDALALRREF